ncbi:MAG: hypothetical protein GEU98_07015 [Pseudonocardiaceae bacterium]|nr:hypothetical protein [Pseudonocardiaceae bacterium]
MNASQERLESTASQADERRRPERVEPVSEPRHGDHGTLNQPWRAVVALIELVVAALAIWGALWAWSNGVVTSTMRGTGGVEPQFTRYYGNWVAVAVGFGLLAGFLVLDAVRQLARAARARAKRQRKRRGDEAEPDG